MALCVEIGCKNLVENEGDFCPECEAEALAEWWADQEDRDAFVVWDEPETDLVEEDCECDLCLSLNPPWDGVEP